MADWRKVAAADARAAGVPVPVFLAQINQESGFQPRVVSKAGAEGIAQIVPKYHPGVDPMDPAAALKYAAQMDAANLKKYGNLKDMLSIYNSGRGWSVGQGIGETNHYVNAILQAAHAAGGMAGASPAALSNQGTPSPTGNLPVAQGVNGALGGTVGSGLLASPQSMMASVLLQAAANGGQMQPSSLLALAALRRAQGAATNAFGAQPTNQPLVSAPTQTTTPQGLLKFMGPTQGVKPSLLNAVSQAAKAAGATQIKITSGYRDPGHNATVGGVQHSNHLTGDAIDGYGLVNGQWVPLGQLLLKTAGRFGLRSGDVPGFFNGGTDPVHVDDGANQH